jgi:hypothetical protein
MKRITVRFTETAAAAAKGSAKSTITPVSKLKGTAWFKSTKDIKPIKTGEVFGILEKDVSKCKKMLAYYLITKAGNSFAATRIEIAQKGKYRSKATPVKDAPKWSTVAPPPKPKPAAAAPAAKATIKSLTELVTKHGTPEMVALLKSMKPGSGSGTGRVGKDYNGAGFKKK